MKRKIRLHNSPQQDILFPRLSLVLLDIFVVHVAFNTLVPRDIKLLLNEDDILFRFLKWVRFGEQTEKLNVWHDWGGIY